MVKLVHENGNLKEAYNDMREAYRKIEHNMPIVKENQSKEEAKKEVETIKIYPASVDRI